MNEHLPTVLVNIVENLAKYPYPHLKELVTTSDLYMPEFLRKHEGTVEIYIDRIIEILASEVDIKLLREHNLTAPECLWWVLEVLWECPMGDFHGDHCGVKIGLNDYTLFHTALVMDGVDVSMLP